MTVHVCVCVCVKERVAVRVRVVWLREATLYTHHTNQHIECPRPLQFHALQESDVINMTRKNRNY